MYENHCPTCQADYTTEEAEPECEFCTSPEIIQLVKEPTWIVYYQMYCHSCHAYTTHEDEELDCPLCEATDVTLLTQQKRREIIPETF